MEAIKCGNFCEIKPKHPLTIGIKALKTMMHMTDKSQNQHRITIKVQDQSF